MLTEEELLDIIDNLSDLSYCSDEDNNGEDDWHNIVEGEEVIQTNDPNLEPEEPTEIIEHEEELFWVLLGEEVIQTNDPNLEPEEPTEIIEHEEETRFT
ncbi:hypothetical protein QE152_g41555, partial [Popillia japonica]